MLKIIPVEKLHTRQFLAMQRRHGRTERLQGGTTTEIDVDRFLLKGRAEGAS